MTMRVYLAAAQVLNEPPQPGDLVAERVFVHASDLPEVWVETEHHTIPEQGKAVTFALARPMGIGFERISGTVERKVPKRVSRAAKPETSATT